MPPRSRLKFRRCEVWKQKQLRECPGAAFFVFRDGVNRHWNSKDPETPIANAMESHGGTGLF
ncbi:hypothetical protein J21TS7_64010 [Paenibacillus cineris]|uniref:Uncharacterized protein n=1 Tax=Paenibacillus cineris TaxID=237530 RepID=A0ABQ4LNK1_9BACL|nr:hypothetical protein J21TS7_64010 [Paenibacillus cineris]